MDVVVGRQQQNWKIHYRALVYRSPLFKRQLCDLNSGISFYGPITLADEDSAAFAAIVPWMYSGELDLMRGIHQRSGIEAYNARLDLASQLCRIFCCGFRLQLKDLNPTVFSLLDETFAAERRHSRRVLVKPDTILNIWRTFGLGQGETLKALLVEEISKCMTSATTINVYDYNECFQMIPNFAATLLEENRRRSRGCEGEESIAADVYGLYN